MNYFFCKRNLVSSSNEIFAFKSETFAITLYCPQARHFRNAILKLPCLIGYLSKAELALSIKATSFVQHKRFRQVYKSRNLLQNYTHLEHQAYNRKKDKSADSFATLHI
jgi:hypothetical protein